MHRCYGSELISERHRHRYEFNNDFRTELENAGLRISGTSPDEYIAETVEIPQNDFLWEFSSIRNLRAAPNKGAPVIQGTCKDGACPKE